MSASAKVWELIKATLGKILAVFAFAIAFLVWGYLHQLFSFADCEGGKADMSVGSIISSGFGFTVCARPNSPK